MMDTYRPSKVYWESLEMIRKLALVGLVLIVGRGTTAQLVVGLALSIFFLMLHMRYLPHKDYYDNCYKAAADTHILIALVVAIALKSRTSRALESEALTPSFYENFLTSSFALLLVLGYFACTLCKVRALRAVKERWLHAEHGGVYRVEAGCCVAKLGAESRRVTPALGRAFDLHSTGAATEPEEREMLSRLLQSYLTGWQKHKRYAAFLSHYKIEAGSSASLLHEALVRSLPGVHESDVFLDSNNLRDLNKLEDHVRESDVLILLLTEKVLSRPACLLELYAAATHNVPIIVLRCEGPSCSQADELPKILSDLPAHLRLHGQSQILDDSGLIDLDAHEVHAAELSKKLRAAMLGLNWRKKLLSFASHASGKHRDGQAAMITKEMVKHTGEFAESNKVVQENAALNTELLSVSEATETKMGLDSTQKLCVVHSEQADDEAVRLRHELTKRTDLTDNQILLRGEVEDLASEGVVVVMMLQTRDVLHETH